jgi:hypothetical protein
LTPFARLAYNTASGLYEEEPPTVVNRSAKCALLTLAVAAVLAPSARAHPGEARPRVDPPTAAELARGLGGPVRDAVLRIGPRMLLQTSEWWGGRRTTSTGEGVWVYVSVAYTVDETRIDALTDFLSGLLHGSELAGLTVYVAPLPLLQTLCKTEHALGCYDPSFKVMVVPGEDVVGGPTVAQVVTHEYGHHVATNRLNTPWPAVDWGTKRWASYVGICARASAGTVFPGDEHDHGDRPALPRGPHRDAARRSAEPEAERAVRARAARARGCRRRSPRARCLGLANHLRRAELRGSDHAHGPGRPLQPRDREAVAARGVPRSRPLPRCLSRLGKPPRSGPFSPSLGTV